MKKLKIGNIELDNQVILAPMAGVCDSAFKVVVRELGASLVCTEMVNDKALIHENERTLKMIKIDPLEHPVAVQLFGSSTETMVKAAKILDQKTDADIIDINMGCPAPKIVKNNGGSKWLNDTDKIYEVVSNIVKNVKKPVTVKMRIGFYDNNINAIENAKAIEKAGASAIFVHGRTTQQMYEGYANWEVIAEVKKAVKIPVIGNGDINSPQKAKEYLEKYKVDGVMIGRAALGNPWIIRNVADYLEKGILHDDPKPSDKFAMCIKHMDYLIDLKGENIAMKEMRAHAAWYVKGIKGSNHLKRAINNIQVRDDLIKIFDEYLQRDTHNAII